MKAKVLSGVLIGLAVFVVVLLGVVVWILEMTLHLL